MNDLYIWPLILALTFAALTIGYLCFRYYPLTIFLVGLSVWIPHIFVQNSFEGSLTADSGMGSYLRIAILLLTGIIGLIKFFQYLPEHKGRIPLQFLILGVFLTFAFVSIAYSLDSNISFIRAATFLALSFYLLGLYAWLNREYDFYQMLNSLYYLVVLLLVLTAFVTVAMPSRAWWWAGRRFIGIWGHPNTTGMFFMATYPILIWKYGESRISGKLFIALLILFVLALHVLTGSRTSLFAAAIGISAWFIVQGKAIKSVITMAVIGFGLFVLVQVRPQSFDREESRKITDVTGRDEFWTGAMMLIQEKPLTGYGYSVKGEVWTDPRFYKEGYALWSGSNRTSLHNGYLSVAVGLGVTGLIILLASIIVSFYKGMKRTDPDLTDYKSFAISVMVMMFLVNFAESSLDSTASLGAIFFWMSWVVSGKLYELKKYSVEIPEEESYEKSYAVTYN